MLLDDAHGANLLTDVTALTPRDVPFPPDPNPHPPRFAVPAGSWDAHFHVFGPPNLFPYAPDRHFTPPAAPIEHWLRVSAAIGIERGLLVTPAIHDLDPAITLDAIARSEGRVRGMVRAGANLAGSDVTRLHRGGIRGVRFPFAKAVGRAFDEPLYRATIARVEHARWVAEFMLDGDALEVHADLVGNVPLPTLLEQFGGVSPAKGVDQPAFRTLLDIVGRPHVYVKLIGADRELRDGQRYEDIVAMARAVIAKAPDRVIWGSDWPHAYVFEAGAVPNDGDLISMLADFAPEETVRNKILVDNPKRLFDFD